MKQKIPVLWTVDGGGMRGYMVAIVHDYLQSKLPLPLSHYITIVAGASTGQGISSLIRAEEKDQQGWYEEHGPLIFTRKKLATKVRVLLGQVGLVGYKYGKAYLHEQLKKAFKGLKLSDVRPTLAMAYNPDTDQVWVMSSEKAKLDPDFDFDLADATLGSMAAPTYFEPAEVTSKAGNKYTLIDGGVFAANPTLMTLAEYFKSHKGCKELPYVISWGTGAEKGKKSTLVGKMALMMVESIIGIQMSGSFQVVDFIVNLLYWFFDSEERYIRLDFDSPGVKMDDASPETMAKMKAVAEKFIEVNKGKLDQIVERLMSNQEAA
ncbi:hypothetical protein BWI97_15640 [Siphonobacter sp. BAB-5405]|uniref:patatin-like phospholipase family protein n=1 Tax=Siphonobacter sp. BAB-5405 TaxID=1864825 RepID=UPI000C80D270|nr:patatin-like phospholipase family protein [Siphonobacter sp. BAB-5405]PMD94829.1 hypothetical protein BWI97_15640 [Siphonobacter sp. BAB-5405]